MTLWSLASLKNNRYLCNAVNGKQLPQCVEKLVDISSLGFTNDRLAAEELTKRIGVNGVPGSSFFREPVHRYIRFHFAKKDETLHRAGERLVAKFA